MPRPRAVERAVNAGFYSEDFSCAHYIRFSVNFMRDMLLGGKKR
jgi:hypothetical protein